MVRVSSGTKRKICPGDEGIRVLAIGAIPGKPYEVPEFTELGTPDPMAEGTLSRQLSITAASPPNDTCQCGEQVAALLN